MHAKPAATPAPRVRRRVRRVRVGRASPERRLRARARAAAMSAVRLTRGVLVTSDEPTIVFLTVLSEQGAGAGGQPFVLRKLGSKRLLVRPDAVPAIRSHLRARLLTTTFEGEDAEAEG